MWYAVSLVADRTGEWIYLSLSLTDRFFFMFMLRNTTTSRDKGGPGTGGPWSPVVGESVPIHKPERKTNGCLGTPDGAPNVCVRSAWPG